MNRATVAPHTRIRFSGLLKVKMKGTGWNSEITFLSVMKFYDMEKKSQQAEENYLRPLQSLRQF